MVGPRRAVVVFLGVLCAWLGSARSAHAEPRTKPGSAGACRASSTDQRYVFVFDERRESFVYPPYGPYAGQELILCIDTPNKWKRYRLVFGAKTVGDDSVPQASTVGYAPAEIDTVLRGASRQLANDRSCNDAEITGSPEPAKKGETPRPSYKRECEHLVTQVKGLVEVAKKVIAHRDVFARELVRKSNRGEDPPTKEAGPSAAKTADSICSQNSVGDFVNGKLKEMEIDKQIVWLDDSWHVIDRSGKAPSIAERPLELALPSTLVAYLNTRAELIWSIQRAMDGCAKLMALSLKIEDEVSRRQTRFRFGKFDGNKIVVATLEEHYARVSFTDDSKHVTYGSETTPHQLTLVVRNTSGYEFSVGVAYSTLDAPDWATSTTTGAGGAVTRRVVRTSDGRDLAPVLFVSFLWCEEPSDRPWISRACRDGSTGWRHWLPRVVGGLPISSDLGRGSFYAGLGLPYVPYVSIAGGLHLRRVKALQDGIREGDSIASDTVPTQDVLRAGGFVSLSVTEEIFHLIVPKLEPAK